MEIFYTAIVSALTMMAFFFLGIYVANTLARNAREDAEYQYRKMMAYHLAGVERPGDPLPYVAPPIKRRRKLPHLKEIEERLNNGERATVKVEENEI